MAGADDKPGRQRQSDSQDADDGDLEEVLRQIGNDILAEDVPERLRRVLRRMPASDGEADADVGADQPGPRDGARGQDGEPSG